MSNPPTEGPLVSQYADDADMLDLIELFVAELPGRIEALDDALAGGDLQRLGALAHQLKGAGGGYGYPSITDTARQLEHLTADGSADLDAVQRHVHNLADLCRRAAAGV